MDRWYIYKTIQRKHPPYPIRLVRTTPPGTLSIAPLQAQIIVNTKENQKQP